MRYELVSDEGIEPDFYRSGLLKRTFPMRTPIFQLDAFTTRRFAGNPAAVMPMDTFPEDDVLQAIAAENTWPRRLFWSQMAATIACAGSRPPPRCHFAATPPG